MRTTLRVAFQKPVVAVGIDVAKTSLSVSLLHQDDTATALMIRNTDADITAKLLPELGRLAAPGRIVMESTSHYHWRAALRLREAGHDVRVINPLLGKKYTSASIRKVKTDAADAHTLARMAQIEDRLPPPFSLTRNALKLRKTLGCLSSLSAHIQAMEAALSSVGEADAATAVERADEISAIRETVRALKRQLGRLEGQFAKEIVADEARRAEHALLTSIPGVSPFVASLALHWFTLREEQTPKSWIAYAGLDVSSRESGTWKGRCRLTKRGNNYLRRRLFGAAWGAVMHDDDFRAYYEHLRAGSRSHVEAMLVITRKIIRIMFMVLAKRMPYDPARFSYGTS